MATTGMPVVEAITQMLEVSHERTWAMVTEAGGCPVELGYELETLGRNNFEGTLQGAFTAHPKIDPSSGEMHAMTYAWPQWLDHVQYVVVASNGYVRKQNLNIPLPGMTMMHDMSLLEVRNYL